MAAAEIVQSEEMDCDTTEECFIIRAKGFPFDTSAAELAAFFAGCDIKDGKNKGIHFLTTGTGKSKSEAYIEFYENDDLKRALGCNKKYLGDRYVDVVSASREQMEEALRDCVAKQDGEDSRRIVKLSGMPFTALHDDISIFFAGCDIRGGKKRGISFLRNNDGSAAGSCYVEFLTPEDVMLALKKDRQYMGNRFCHVSGATEEERESALTKQTEVLQDLAEPIIKLKGLPFKTCESDIRNFFPELEILSMEMVLNDQGNCRGEAFLEFGSTDDAKEAMKCYKLKLLHRFVDVTKSTRAEWISMIPASEKITKTAEDLDEPILKLNNLPLKVTKEEIEDFMFGLECRAIQVVRMTRGDCNGEAFIEFMNLEDTASALAKHKQPLNGESGRDKLVEVTPSSRCDWRKEPAVFKSSKSDRKSDRDRDESSSRSRKRPLSLDHSSSSDRYQQPRMSAPVGYPTTYGGYNTTQVGYGDRIKEYLVNMVGLPFSAQKKILSSSSTPSK